MYEAAELWTKARLAERSMERDYALDGAQGGFCIANADSQQEIWDSLLDYPLYPFFDSDVKPICDAEHARGKLGEIARKLVPGNA